MKNNSALYAIILIFPACIVISGCGNQKISVKQNSEEVLETVKLDLNNESVHYALGVSYLSESNYTEAIKSFKEAVELNEHYAEAYFALYCATLASDNGLLKALTDEDDPAEQYSKRIDTVKNYLYMALMSNPFFEWKLARMLTDDKLQASSLDGKWLIDMYNSLFRDGYENLCIGDYYAAVQNFNYAITKTPANMDEKDLFIYVASNNGAEYEAYLAQYKNRNRFYRAFANALMMNYTGAISDFKFLAASLEKKNNEGSGIFYLNPAEYYFLIACCYYQMNDLTNAEEYFKKTLTEDLSYYMAHYHLSTIYYEQKKFDEAISELDAALLVAPNSSIMHFNRGYMLSQFQRYEEAVAEYDKALELNPRYYRASYNAGILHDALNNKEKAIERFQTFINTAPLEQAEAVAKVKEKLSTLK